MSRKDQLRYFLLDFDRLGEPGVWSELAGRYRQLLYIKGETRGVTAAGRPIRPGFSMDTVEQVVALKGKLPINELLRCRVRYFTDGVIFAVAGVRL
ncbi:MAG: hypothetical protein WCS52_04640 [bacterium]